MATINRLLVNICSSDLQKSRHFYENLFDFKITFESDWFIHMRSELNGLELAVILAGHEVVPHAIQGKGRGFYITFVVENVDLLFSKIKNDEYRIVEAPKNTFYGQRRMLIEDPDGNVIDVSSPISN